MTVSPGKTTQPVPTKTLDAIATALGARAQDAMTPLYPFLGETCRQLESPEVRVDFLLENPYPPALPPHEPLQAVLQTLQAWLLELLSKEGIQRSDVRNALVAFQFKAPGSTPASSGVVSTVVTRAGRIFSHKLRSPG